MKARILALTLALVVAAGGQVGAQGSMAEGYKDPEKASQLGLVLPGAGHLYAGESGKGWLLMLTSVGAVTAGTIMTLNSIGGDEDDFLTQDFGDSEMSEETNVTPFYVGAGVYALGWLYSVMDAGKAAVRTNQKSGLGNLPGTVAPYLSTRGGNTEYGLRLQVRL